MSKCDGCTSALSSSSVCNLMSGVEVRVEMVLKKNGWPQEITI